MTSIRVSLMMYFLLLLAVALGVVSVLVYQANADAVAEKREFTSKLLLEQYLARAGQLDESLNRRILRRAQLLATLAESRRYHLERFFTLGAIGASAAPNGHLFALLWLAEGLDPALAIPMHHSLPPIIRIPSAEDVMASVPNDQPNEYFQASDKKGNVQERSANMGKHALQLDGDFRSSAALLEEKFDNAILADTRVRTVTLRANAPFVEDTSLSPAWPRTLATQEKWLKWQQFWKKDVDFFVQYASNLEELDAAKEELKLQRLQRLDALDEDNERSLATLRSRLIWTSLVTFLAVLIGGFWLVRVGLAPLDRFSHAVSRVSERNFQLRIRGYQIPLELQPIARRLTETFEKLERAFEREKQAVADISHELRTPLASFLTNLDVMLRKPRTAEEYRQVLEDCRDAGQHLSRLVERLLTLARLDAGSDTLRPQQVDAVELARQCAAMVRPLADARNVAIRLHLDGTAPMLGDPDKIREIFNNLLHNAIEYNRPDGSIDVHVRSNNASVFVEVRDTGVGISPEARERIFERFYRGDPSRHADTLHAGIGLAIVKSYVALMHGDISVESDEKGTAFRVKLPAGNGDRSS